MAINFNGPFGTSVGYGGGSGGVTLGMTNCVTMLGSVLPICTVGG